MLIRRIKNILQIVNFLFQHLSWTQTFLLSFCKKVLFLTLKKYYSYEINLRKSCEHLQESRLMTAIRKRTTATSLNKKPDGIYLGKSYKCLQQIF